jgi:CRP-like cAMP-binding protein
VFGELSVLLDQPHTADVRALEASQFHVADAATTLRVDPIALLYVVMTRLRPAHRRAEISRPTAPTARNSCVRPSWAGSRLSSFLSRASPAAEHRV